MSLTRALVLFPLLLVLGCAAPEDGEDASVSESAPRFTDLEVQIESTAEGIVIAGTLSIPTGSGPHPALLMITGNGPHTREQRISDTPMFTLIANHFAQRGMAVLRTDARGFGTSTGPDDWEQTTTQDRIEDNLAVFRFLQSRAEIDPERIVLLGHSEGAMIAAALAAAGEPSALTVLLSTSALPGNEVFARQMSDNLRRRGASDEVAEAVRHELLRFTDFLATDRDDRPRFEALALDFLAAHGVPRDQLDPELAQGLLEGYLHAPWYWHFVADDPRDDLSRIRTPVFAIFAGADENVPWRTHLPSLASSLAEGGNPDFTTTVLPDQDHFFLEFEGHRLEAHRPGEMVVADELFAVLDAEFTRRGLW